MFHLGLGLGFVGMEVVDDGGIYRQVGVIEVPEVGCLCGMAVGEVDGRLHLPGATRRPLLLDLAPVLRPVLRPADVAELRLIVCMKEMYKLLRI